MALETRSYFNSLYFILYSFCCLHVCLTKCKYSLFSLTSVSFIEKRNKPDLTWYDFTHSNLTSRNSNSLMSRDVPYIKVNTTMLFGFTKVTHNFKWPLSPKVKKGPSVQDANSTRSLAIYNLLAWDLRIKHFWEKKRAREKRKRSFKSWP